MTDKFDKEGRTFETRLVYIKEIFSNKYSQDDILKGCIEYKLNKTYETYLRELKHSVSILTGLDKPVEVLKKLD